MATINGRGGAIYVGSEGLSVTSGTATAEVISYSVETSINLIDDTELSDPWTTNQDGVKSWSASVEALYDPADTTGQDLLVLGNGIGLVIAPNGSTSGAEIFYGNCRVNSISRSADNSTMVKVSFSVTGNGALTAGNNPS